MTVQINNVGEHELFRDWTIFTNMKINHSNWIKWSKLFRSIFHEIDSLVLNFRIHPYVNPQEAIRMLQILLQNRMNRIQVKYNNI